MKSFICLFLAVCLALSLCACGTDATNNVSSVTDDVVDTVSTDDVVDDDEDFNIEDAKSDSKYYDEYGNTLIVALDGNKLTKSNVIRTGWQCTYYTDNGDKVYTRFILDFDSKYQQLFAINGLLDHTDKGTYEVKGGKLYLYLNGETATSTVYEYKNENLTNNGNEYTPYSE